jgi:hypothetical protein
LGVSAPGSLITRLINPRIGAETITLDKPARARRTGACAGKS